MDKRIGAQLFTVRDFCKTPEDFQETVKKLSETGYKVVQLSAIGNFPPEEVKKICEREGMTIACTHRSIAEYREKLDFIVDYHRACGCTVAGLGAYPGLEELKNEAEVMETVDFLNGITRKLKENGLTFAYHNHAFEFKKINGRFIMDYFLEYGEFDFITDVYWLAVAGINPAEFIRRNADRIKMIHYKDLKVVNNAPEMCEVLEGNLDWDSIITASFDSGAEFALVEQDFCGNTSPFDCMRTSYNNLKAKGFE